MPSPASRPRPTASLPEASLFHFSTEVRVRLPETDAMGIVFHGYFFTYLEVGRMDYLRNLGLAESSIRPIRGFSNLVRHVECDFVSPARFDDLLVVQVRLAEIGRTSFRFEFLIRHKRDNRPVAHGQSVHVAVDDSAYRPIPVPDEFRDRIRDFEKTGLIETGTPVKRPRKTGRPGGNPSPRERS